MKYNEEDDTLLVDMICETNEEVRDSLYKKYEPTIKGVVKRYKNKALKIGLDFNDLVQEANLGFTDAINKYDYNKENATSTLQQEIATTKRKHKAPVKNSFKIFLSFIIFFINTSIKPSKFNFFFIK